MFIVRGKAINVQYIFFMVSDSFCLCQHICSAFFKKNEKTVSSNFTLQEASVIM